ncbi:MAG: hypothetical protein ACP5O0_07320 [Acidimicrobiales bacterium]
MGLTATSVTSIQVADGAKGVGNGLTTTRALPNLLEGPMTGPQLIVLKA